MEKLPDCNTLINQAFESGNSVLHVASRNGNAEMVELLLNYGADNEARNNDRNTALHLACQCGHKRYSCCIKDFLVRLTKYDLPHVIFSN